MNNKLYKKIDILIKTYGLQAVITNLIIYLDDQDERWLQLPTDFLRQALIAYNNRYDVK